MTKTPVQYHTICQLVAALGAEDDGKGFHIFKITEHSRKIPLQHPCRSDYFSFLFVTGGEACLKVNLMDHTIKKNSFLVISPNDLRQFQQISRDFSFIGIGATRDFIVETGIHKKNIDAFDFFSSQTTPLLKLEDEDTKVILSLFDVLCKKSDEKGSGSFYDQIIHFSFSAFIFEIASLFRKVNIVHTKITRKEDLVIRFLKLLPLHFKEERSLGFYANLLFVTPKYLTQTIKEITGKTAGEFIDEMVIMEAKALLNDLSASIRQVAEELNFSDQFFFSKFFKKHVQLNPSQYRRSL